MPNRSVLGEQDRATSSTDQYLADLYARIDSDRQKRQNRRRIKSAATFIGASIALLAYARINHDEDQWLGFEKATEMTPELEQIENKMDIAADNLLERDVDVFCAHFPQPGIEEGKIIMGKFVELSNDTRIIAMERVVCQDLLSISEGQTAFTSDQDKEDLIDGLIAIANFSHEIAHGEGVLDEGMANCRAVELYPRVAEELGAASFIRDDIDADALFKSLNQPPVYHSAGC